MHRHIPFDGSGCEQILPVGRDDQAVIKRMRIKRRRADAFWQLGQFNRLKKLARVKTARPEAVQARQLIDDAIVRFVDLQGPDAVGGVDDLHEPSGRRIEHHDRIRDHVAHIEAAAVLVHLKTVSAHKSMPARPDLTRFRVYSEHLMAVEQRHVERLPVG